MKLKEHLMRAVEEYLDHTNPYLTLGELADTFRDIECDLLENSSNPRMCVRATAISRK